jgi:hypothetical protein
MASTAQLYAVSRATLYRLLREDRRPKDAYRSDRGSTRAMPADEIERLCEIVVSVSAMPVSAALTRIPIGNWKPYPWRGPSPTRPPARNRKGTVLSDVTAQKEYGVTRDFILKGVQAGELEFRKGAVWGNPYLRVLRSQLERYIVVQLGSKYLVSKKSQTELHAISKEIAAIRKKLALLEARKVELEHAIKTQRNPTPSVTM